MRALVIGALALLPAGALAQDARRVRAVEEAAIQLDEGTRIGEHVAISGDGTRAVLGGPSPGVRVLARDARGWSVEAVLEPRIAASSVAISGDGSRVVVGAARGGEPSVRVFERVGSSWSEETTLRSHAGADQLGAAVAITRDGTRIAAGAPHGDREDADDSGVVYVYALGPDGWRAEAELRAHDGARRDGLGASIAISDDGDRVIAGMPGDDCGDGWDCGSARVFARAGAEWSVEGVLVADDGRAGDRLGAAVAIDGAGRRAIAGAPGDDRSVDDQGSARVFARDAAGWRDEATLDAARETRGQLGRALAMSRDGARVVVGAPRDGRGVVHVITRHERGWRREGELPARRIGARAALGSALAIDDAGTRVLAGAPLDDTPGREAAGTARVIAIPDRTGRIPWVPLVARVDSEGGEIARVASDPATACAPRCDVVLDPGEIEIGVDGIDGAVRLLLSEPATLRVSRRSREAERALGLAAIVLGWSAGAAIPIAIRGVEPCDDASTRCSSSTLGGAIGLGVGLGALSTLAGLPLALAEDEVALDGELESGGTIAARGDGSRAIRIVAEIGGSIVILGAGAGLMVLLTWVGHGGPGGFGTSNATLSLALGVPAGTLVTAALTASLVTGFGAVAGGRGHWLHAAAGFGVGAVLGAGIFAALHELAFPGGQELPHSYPVIAVGASLAVLVAGAGAIAGYELGDESARSGDDPFVVLPSASVSADGAIVGAVGAF